MTNTDLEFIQSALNAYWNDAHQQLQRKDLGDIERKNYEYQLSNSKRLLTQIEQSHIQVVMQGLLKQSDVSAAAKKHWADTSGLYGQEELVQDSFEAGVWWACTQLSRQPDSWQSGLGCKRERW